MKELILSAKFRELEGEWIVYDRDGRPWVVWDMLGRVGDIDSPEFCPIRNLALNCAASFKYAVNINHCTQFDCGPDGSGSFDIPFVSASIKSLTGDFEAVTPLNEVEPEKIARAIIECILKSRGLV